MKYQIRTSVVRSVQMYWVFSTQKLNSAIALLGTQTVKYIKRKSEVNNFHFQSDNYSKLCACIMKERIL